jgi:hypothetical protein
LKKTLALWAASLREIKTRIFLRQSPDPRRLGPRPDHARSGARSLGDRRRQPPIEHWHEMIPNPTIADAILDRLAHNAHRLTLKGESMRKTASNNAGHDVKQNP